MSVFIKHTVYIMSIT